MTHDDFENHDLNEGPEEEPDIDREIRINEMRRQIEEMGGSLGPTSSGLPPEIEEQFLANILRYEQGPFTTHFEQLGRDGLVLFPPEEVTDEALPELIDAIMQGLAKHNTYVTSTDHLSDRELYTHLWRETLREDVPDFEPDPDTHFHIDLVSSGNEEEIEAWLTYYADEETRQHWIRDFPDDKLPPRKNPPYDRDRYLPREKHPGEQEES